MANLFGKYSNFKNSLKFKLIKKSFSDLYWDDKDAQVVCRTLGFSDKNATATTRSKFGKVGSTEFSMYNVMCDGTESHIGLCTHDATPDWFSSSHGAGVICGLILS